MTPLAIILTIIIGGAIIDRWHATAPKTAEPLLSDRVVDYLAKAPDWLVQGSLWALKGFTYIFLPVAVFLVAMWLVLRYHGLAFSDILKIITG